MNVNSRFECYGCVIKFILCINVILFEVINYFKRYNLNVGFYVEYK